MSRLDFVQIRLSLIDKEKVLFQTEMNELPLSYPVAIQLPLI